MPVQIQSQRLAPSRTGTENPDPFRGYATAVAAPPTIAICRSRYSARRILWNAPDSASISLLPDRHPRIRRAQTSLLLPPVIATTLIRLVTCNPQLPGTKAPDIHHTRVRLHLVVEILVPLEIPEQLQRLIIAQGRYSLCRPYPGIQAGMISRHPGLSAQIRSVGVSRLRAFSLASASFPRNRNRTPGIRHVSGSR